MKLDFRKNSITMSISVCKHWVRTQGHCSFGDNCKFGHPVPIPSTPIDQPRPGKRPKIRNRAKAGIFRRWLIDTFGKAILQSGLIEVAGGKGELSFELVNLNGIPCTVIDPRPLDCSRFVNRLLAGYYHKNQVFLSYIDNKDVPTEPNVHLPNSLRLFFESPLWENSWDSNESNLSDMYTRSLNIEWTDKGLVDTYETIGIPKEWPNWNTIQQILDNCGIIVGLHPDQAVEAIVDFALARDKPFAVIPCCTYHKQFPGRNWKGKPLKKYNDLCDYLLAKDYRIQQEVLPFEGKNRVLYLQPNMN
eukprot:TRINITY_DN3078_c0_g1_i2.p1 TRINITY_DN3078_c0_g1~~TRINITY_DN3078_c0_g1_i2.p1  ORF type:complete len:304 (-),score=41.99 TRINITY_DN3078_c0_g1_i2:610-1521(-)